MTGLSRSWLLVGALSSLLAGCGSDSDSPTNAGSGGSTGGAAGTTGSGGSAGTGGSAGSGGTAGVGGSSTSTQMTVEVVLHPSQPMVVDLEISAAQGTPAARVEADPGVRAAAATTNADGSFTIRLRGLSPGADTVVELSDNAGSLNQDFRTLDPLPGFIASFPVTTNPSASAEYRMFDLSAAIPFSDSTLYVVDPNGKTRFYLPFPNDADGANLPNGIKLLDDGTVLFNLNDEILIIDELGQTELSVLPADLGVEVFHHDVIEVPGGRFMTLSIATEDIFYPDEGVTHFVGGDVLVEFDRSGTATWTWNSFDHLDPLRKRMDFDLLFYPIYHPVTGEALKDWTHANGLIHSPADNSIILSVRHQDWLLKIDRPTGDIVWRLGEEGDFTLPSGQSWFYHPHSPELQADGSLLLYDNGNGNPNLPLAEWRTRPIQLTFNTNNQQANVVWEGTRETYLSPIAGDVDRLSNGNLLVLDSVISVAPPEIFPASMRIREVNPQTGEWLWVLESDDGLFSYRAVPTLRLPGEAAN